MPHIVEELVERPDILERIIKRFWLVDVFFVQFIDGVDVPVLMQGRVLQFLDKVVYMPLRPMIGA